MAIVSTGQFFIIDVNDGSSLYTAAIYQQALTQPNTPVGGSYNYSSLTLTGPTGWSSTLPSATTTPTWVSYYTFSTSDKTATVTASTWSVPTIYSQKGDPGLTAKTLKVVSDRQSISYDNSGNLYPATQTITFTTQKQNTTATVTWTMTTADGTTLNASTYLSATSGDSVTLSAANFNTARGSSQGVIVTGSITDGSTMSDSVSVLKTIPGANAIAVAFSNPTHFFQSSADGTISSYTGSGTKIYVYEGPSELQFVTGTSTTTAGTWCLSAATTLDVASNLTIGSISVSGKEALLTDYTSNTTSNTFTSSYALFTISGVLNSGVTFTSITAKQQLNKNKVGANAIDGSLSNTPINLLCDVTGTVISYASATGNFKVVDGSNDVSASSTFSMFSQSNCIVTINSSGVYSVSSITADVASAVIQAIYGSVTIKKTLSITRTKNGTTIGVSLSNDSQAIPCDKNGTALTGGYTGTGTNIYVYDGSVQLIYDANFSTNNTTGTYKVTVASASNITAGSIVSGGVSPNFYAVINDHSAITQNSASIIYTISGKNAAGSTFSTTKTQSFSKVLSGSTGADAVSYYIKSDYYSLSKDDNNTYSPTSVTFSSTTKTGAAAATSYSGRFKVFENNSATASYTSAADEASYTYTPTSSCTIIKAILYAAGGTTTQLDTSSVAILLSGSNTISATLSNDAQSIPTDVSGTVVANGYIGSGTEIHIYEGSTELTYDGTGTSAGKWKVVTSTSGITAGTVSASATTPAYAIYSDHSAFTGNTGSIKYTMSGKTSTGKAFSIAKVQSFSKSKQGSDSVIKRIVLSSGGLSKSALNAFTPSTVTISAQSVTGSGTPTSYSGRFKVFENNSVTASYTSAADEASYTYTPSSACTSIQVILYAAGGTTTQLDTQGVLITLNGVDGSNAAIFRINNAGVTFTKNKSTITPTSTTLTTTYQNISGTITYQWQKNGSNIATSGTSSSYIVNSTDFTNAQSVIYTCIISGTINGSASSLSDSITIPRLDTGKDSVSVVASNENISFQAQSSGYNNIIFTNGSCDISVYIGSTALTYAASGSNTFSCTFTSTNATVAAGSNTTNTFTVPAPTAMSADYGYTDVVISIIDGDNVALSKPINKRISYSLSRNGISATTAVLSNESHTFPATYVGAVSAYTGSGTDIYVYEGTTALTYDGVGTSNGKWKVTATGTNITPGTITNNTSYATYGVHSGVANATDTSQIVYSISGTTSLGQSFALSKIQKFTKSKAGVDNITGYLTNESITLAAASDGTVSSFSGATGTFKVTNGITDVTTSSAFSVSTLTNTTVSINATTGVYTVTALSSDTGSAVLQAVYSGVTLQKTLTLAKSKAGTNGSAALILKVSANKQTITYDSSGASLTPASQTITFSAQKVNTTATVNWTLADGSGTALSPVTTYLSAASGNSVTMTGAQFTSARGSTSSVTVTGTLTDGSNTLTDSSSVVMVNYGAKGDVGPTVKVTSSRSNVFSFTDGVSDTSNNGTITFTANVFNMTVTSYGWTLSLDGGVATSISTTSTATLTAATFASSKSAQITCTVATATATYIDTVTVTRLDKSTAAAGATVGATWGTNISNQPSSLSGINSTEGSKLAGVATGANNTYIDASGNIQGVSSGAGTAISNSLITPSSIGAAATADLNNKLNKSSADVLTGTITLGTGGMFLAGTTSNGVYIGPSGLTGISGGNTFFSITTSGNAIFKGSLTGSSGTFGSTSNGLTLDGVNGILTVNRAGTTAVKMGYLSSTTNYGIEGYNSSGTTVFRLDNVTGLDAKITESALNLMGLTYRQKLIISGDYTLTVPASGTTSANINIPLVTYGCFNIIFQITGYWENSGITLSSAFMTYGTQGVYYNNATGLQASLGTVNYIAKDNTDATNFPYTRGTVAWDTTLNMLQVKLVSRTGSSAQSGSLCKYSYIVWAVDNYAYPFTKY